MTYSLHCQTATVPDPDYYGIFLHGYGASGADLIGLAPVFQQVMPKMSMVSPDAPDICRQNPSGFEWFDLRDFSPAAMQRVAETALPKLRGFLDSVAQQHQIGYDQMVLVGFSQGTAMALMAAMHLEESFHAVIGFSGFLPQHAAENRGRHCTPIHLVHGDQDDIVPIEASLQAQSQLQGQGFETSLQRCPGLGHGIDDNGLHSATAFLRKI